MENIFENAKFGDKFVTDLGLVLFVEKENDHYLLLQESVEFRTHKKNNAFLNYDSDGKAHCRNRGWDIVSKYKENTNTSINDESLVEERTLAYTTGQLNQQKVDADLAAEWVENNGADFCLGEDSFDGSFASSMIKSYILNNPLT